MQINSSKSFSCYLWWQNSHNSRFSRVSQKFYSNALSNVGRCRPGKVASVNGRSDESPNARNAVSVQPLQLLGTGDESPPWQQRSLVSSATNRRKLGSPFRDKSQWAYLLVVKSTGASVSVVHGSERHFLVAKLVFAGSRFSVNTMRSYLG